MKKYLLIALGLLLWNVESVAQRFDSNKFDELLPILTAPVPGQEIEPKTTEEMARYFNTSDKQIPRIFVKNFPSDFTKNNDPRLFAKVITALIMRENETIAGERILLLLLKDKLDNNIEWNADEQEFFDHLVMKYDSTLIKTTQGRMMDLYYKIDEVPPALAIAQAALQTTWGSEKLDQLYGQKEWLDGGKRYDFYTFSDLLSATHAYVMDMNTTANYDDWRNRRINHRQDRKNSAYLAKGLRTYMPENVTYVQQVVQIMNQAPFIFDFDNVVFKEQ